MSRDAYARIELLLSQNRYDLARRDLAELLADDPDNAIAHAWMAICLLNENKAELARSEAGRAVTLEPENPYSHYVMALTHAVLKAHPETIDSANEALRLDPTFAPAHAVLARSRITTENYEAALAAADAGLAIEPENVALLNDRTVALERLGRIDEAIAAGSQSLQQDPDDSYSHATAGWTFVNSGRYREAQTAFRESLRLDPDNNYARQGMIVALNSRSLIFRAMHRFHVMLSRLQERSALLIIFGAWVLIHIISRNADQLPGGQYWATPMILLYVGFAIMTWVATPLFNAFLRFHPFGRHLLDRKQIWQSNLIAACILLSILSIICLPFLLGFTVAFGVAFYWMLSLPLIASVFAMPTVGKTRIFAVASVVVMVLPIWGIFRAFSIGSDDPFFAGYQQFIYGVIGLQIAANLMARRTS